MSIRGKMIRIEQNLQYGFALPTVLIASIAMFIVLLAAVSAAVAVRTSLSDQYYNKLAQSAADAGAEYAKACLAQNNSKPLWGYSLRPGFTCQGERIDPTKDETLYVMSNDKIQTTFEVFCTKPTIKDANNKDVCDNTDKLDSIKIVGTVSLLNKDKNVWRQYTHDARLDRRYVTKKQVSVGYANSCALTEDGNLYCWGYNRDGAVGNFNNGGEEDGPIASCKPYGYDGSSFVEYCKSSPTPFLVNGTNNNDASKNNALAGKEVSFVAAGSAHVCAIDTYGKVYCWGNNWNRGEPDLPKYGFLGVGDTSAESIPYPKAVSQGTLKFKEIAAGDYHTCGLTDDNKVYCWGRNDQGQLGIGSTVNNSVPAYTSLSNVKQITAGHKHTCALKLNGEVYCWGDNEFYQLGDTAHTSISYNALTPQIISGAWSFSSLSTGSGNGNHTCAIDSSGRLYCWGWNGRLTGGTQGNGQLGDGTDVNSNQPKLVLGLSGKTITAVSTGDFHTCAIDNQGKAYCWGWNRNSNTKDRSDNTVFTYGQLGLGVDGLNATSCGARLFYTYGCSEAKPVKDDGALKDVKLVTIGASHGHTCAMDENNNFYCWGGNTLNEFGIGGKDKATTIIGYNSMFSYSNLPMLTHIPLIMNHYY